MTASSQVGDGGSARVTRSWLTHVRSGPAFLLGGIALVLCLGALACGVARPIGWSPFGINVADSLIVLSGVSAFSALLPWNRWSLAALVAGAASVASWVTYATQGQLGLPVALGWALVVWAYVGPPATAVLAILAARARWFAESGDGPPKTPG
jgi:hypothetical protein